MAVRRRRAVAPPHPGPWYLFKGQLLVACLNKNPGVITSTLKQALSENPTPLLWGSLQCFSLEWEEDLRRHAAASTSVEEFLRRLKTVKYRMETESPRFKRRPYVRL